MNPETIAAAEAYYASKERYEGYCATNIFGKTAAERAEIDLSIRRAMREMMSAQDFYNAALEKDIRQ